ncbi:MAG: glycosyltransferase [Helicobacteraceae bacterium]|nr:glycosyltransferase [Helicobacteraceae bacterium]
MVNQEVLLNGLLEANFYVHPSYIDNSPNSVCEAQILGIPVICTNVGGVSSLVEDNKTGFLVPANDPIKIADIIVSTYNNESLLNEISENEISVAKKRHNPDSIKRDLIMIYNEMVANK